MTDLAALWLIVLLGFSAEASFGFGATVITVTLASHLFPIDVLLPAVVPVNLMLSSYLVIRHRHAVDAALLLRRILPPMIAGLAVGLAVMRRSSDVGLKLAFALFVVTLSVLELRRLLRDPAAAGGAARALPLPVRVGMIFGAGIIHGLFGSGGPLVVYVAGREIDDKLRFRSTLSALWITMSTLLLVGYGVSGLLTAASACTSVLLAPTVLLAIAIGERVHGRIDERRFRLAVFALLAAAGSALAWSIVT